MNDNLFKECKHSLHAPQDQGASEDQSASELIKVNRYGIGRLLPRLLRSFSAGWRSSRRWSAHRRMHHRTTHRRHPHGWHAHGMHSRARWHTHWGHAGHAHWRPHHWRHARRHAHHWRHAHSLVGRTTVRVSAAVTTSAITSLEVPAHFLAKRVVRHLLTTTTTTTATWGTAE